MTGATDSIGYTAVFLKLIAGIAVGVFLIYSLYFHADYNYGFFKGILAFLGMLFFIGLVSMFPFGNTLTPILFEWFWHDIPFWEFTIFAWIVTGISFVANLMLFIGIAGEQRR